MLRWNRVTEGSRTILPAYPILAIALGLIFIIQSPERTSGPAFTVAKEVLSIHQWGIIFLALGIFKTVAFAAHNSTWMRYALVVGCGLSGFWAALIFWSALSDVHVSFSSCLWPSFACWAHVASVRSLARDVVIRSSH